MRTRDSQMNSTLFLWHSFFPSNRLNQWSSHSRVTDKADPSPFSSLYSPSSLSSLKVLCLPFIKSISQFRTFEWSQNATFHAWIYSWMDCRWAIFLYNFHLFVNIVLLLSLSSSSSHSIDRGRKYFNGRFRCSPRMIDQWYTEKLIINFSVCRWNGSYYWSSSGYNKSETSDRKCIYGNIWCSTRNHCEGISRNFLLSNWIRMFSHRFLVCSKECLDQLSQLDSLIPFSLVVMVKHFELFILEN